MSEFLGSIWWLLVALGLLITFHEFGHYWVARRMGVRVLKFSIGFGRKLWSRTGKDGTEYVIAALPLGGYVKMLDEREAPVDEGDLDEAFNRKSVWARIAVVAAGPAFNLVFALVAFWLMFLLGMPEFRPIVGEVNGIAASAGIKPGDRIVSVDGDSTLTWQNTVLGLINPALDREKVTIELKEANGLLRSIELDLGQLGSDFQEENTLEEIGITPWQPKIPALVGEVSPNSPAYRAGFKVGDRLVSIGGEPIADWYAIGELVQKHGSEGEVLTVTVERAGGMLDVDVRPEESDSGNTSGRLILGVAPQPASAELQAEYDRAFFMHKYGPVEGVAAAGSQMWRLTKSTVGVLGRMLTGSASVRNLSGPISIAQFANSSAKRGVSSFLFFLGYISLSLGILNLLPIPVLDGGHLFYYLIELAKGSPVSEEIQAKGQYIGLMLLFGLMGIVFFNDILRLVG